jgi:hypothetical protein
MHAHYVLHRCLQAWHRVAEEHSTELWIAAQMALTPQQRSCRMVLRGWMRHVHEQQVGVHARLQELAGCGRAYHQCSVT